MGGDGDDRLYGGASTDDLEGGLGKDVMWGGAHQDTFLYRSVEEIDGDEIRDFKRTGSENDKVDLRNIDAMELKPGDQKFKFIGNKSFTGQEGELQSKKGVVRGDTDGDASPDFTLLVNVRLADDDFFN